MASLPHFRIDRLESSTGSTIKLAGELDSATSTQLLERIEQALAASSARELVIDLEQVSFIDSSGIRAIIVLERRAKEDGIALALVPPPATVTDLLWSRAWPTRSRSRPSPAATGPRRLSSSVSRSSSRATRTRRRGPAPSSARRSATACPTSTAPPRLC